LSEATNGGRRSAPFFRPDQIDAMHKAFEQVHTKLRLTGPRALPVIELVAIRIVELERCGTLPHERGRMSVGGRTMRTALSRPDARDSCLLGVAGASADSHGRASRDLDRGQHRSVADARSVFRPRFQYPRDLAAHRLPLPLATPHCRRLARSSPVNFSPRPASGSRQLPIRTLNTSCPCGLIRRVQGPPLRFPRQVGA
jgi:hypothetical protein